MEPNDYCAFSKAVEHFGDRWSLVIVRDLLLHGTLGFNALADGLPGISRSVLAARLHKLEDLGIVDRDRVTPRGVPGYRLTHAGRELTPVLRGLRAWSERFVPQDPAMVERDPEIVPKWLSQRVDPERLPDRPVVIELRVSDARLDRFWIVIEPDNEPSVCIEDPCLDAGRYVFLESDWRSLSPVASGAREMAAAVDDGSVRVFGDPRLVHAMPGWFRTRASVTPPTDGGAPA